jgi:hypothetical protein
VSVSKWGQLRSDPLDTPNLTPDWG